MAIQLTHVIHNMMCIHNVANSPQLDPLAPGGTLDGCAVDTSKMVALVNKLNQCISQLEQFQVKVGGILWIIFSITI